MAERSLPHDRALNTSPENILLDRIEYEIGRLRGRRPALDAVIDRAASIIVAHLACRRQRVIRVRFGLGRRYKFLFRSLNDRGATYVISPSVWSCSCPAYHRTEGRRPCKHALAAYVLWRAAQPEPKATRHTSCDGCDQRFPLGEMVELHPNNHDGLTHFDGDVLCHGCANGAGVPW